MVQVTMRDQDMVQPFETDAGMLDLALRALAAIDQETVLIMHDHLGRESAMDRWG
jgi:hypothetical protein